MRTKNWFNTSCSSLMLDAYDSWTLFFLQFQAFSNGLRSSEWLGYSSTAILISCNFFSQVLSYEQVIIYALKIDIHDQNCRKWFFRIYKYLLPFIVILSGRKYSTPLPFSSLKTLHTITLFRGFTVFTVNFMSYREENLGCLTIIWFPLMSLKALLSENITFFCLLLSNLNTKI